MLAPSDIAGFTAWASAKDPIMVFMLLETIYASFDKIASAFGVFKVETVGDCYGKTFECVRWRSP